MVERTTKDVRRAKSIAPDHINARKVAFGELGGVYLVDLQLAIVFRERTLEEINDYGKGITEQILIEELVHGSSSNRAYQLSLLGEVPTLLSYELSTIFREQHTRQRLGTFISEGFARYCAAEYLMQKIGYRPLSKFREYLTYEIHEGDFSKSDNLYVSSLVKIINHYPDFHNDSFYHFIPLMYAYLSALNVGEPVLYHQLSSDGRLKPVIPLELSCDMNAISGYAIELLIAKNPNLKPVFIDALTTPDGLFQLRDELETMHPGLFQLLWALQEEYLSFHWGLEYIKRFVLNLRPYDDIRNSAQITQFLNNYNPFDEDPREWR